MLFQTQEIVGKITADTPAFTPFTCAPQGIKCLKNLIKVDLRKGRNQVTQRWQAKKDSNPATFSEDKLLSVFSTCSLSSGFLGVSHIIYFDMDLRV